MAITLRLPIPSVRLQQWQQLVINTRKPWRQVQSE